MTVKVHPSRPRAVPKAADHPAPASRETIRRLLAESTLTSKGQITVPQAIRAMYQLESGDGLVWRLEADGRLVVEPKRALDLAGIRAAIAAAGAPAADRAFTRQEMEEAIGQALEARHGRH